ncbi:T6SS immunity protein Tli4 family protein, partial [Enterobacteriaceae bacterium LUAb1]
PELYGNTVPAKRAELTRLLTRITGRKEGEIPRQAGFCLPEIFIADGEEKHKEELDIIYTSTRFAKTKFSFSTDNFNKTEDTMLERSSEINKSIAASQGRTLRKGKREIQGLSAQEWLIFGKTEHDEKALRFEFHANESVTGPDAPWLYISFLQRNFSGDNQLSENEAISAWETITSTLRLRPGAFRK